MADNNKVRFGLREVHIFPVESESAAEVTYGSPFTLKGAVNLSLNPQGDSVDFYADDMVYFGEFANAGYEGSLEVALLNEEFETLILGRKKDSNGVVLESLDDKVKNFAMAFMFNGDKKNTKHILYYCTASRPSMSAHTIEKQKTPATDTLTFKCSGHPIRRFVKARVSEGEKGYADFFTAVYIST